MVMVRGKEFAVSQHEVETTVNGRARDFNVDANGQRLVVEAATTLAEIPDPREWRSGRPQLLCGEEIACAR